MKLCDLNTSKVLQEIGYDGEYHHGYTNIGELTNAKTWVHFPAPRLDDAAYWLRNKHNCHITICPLDLDGNGKIGYKGACYAQSNNKPFSLIYVSELQSTYNDALEAAVTKAIEIIKNEKR